jgi:hypothetical protein
LIAELAAFNAGFAVVKQFVANGRDLSDAMGAIGQMVGAKEELAAKRKRKAFYPSSAVKQKTTLKSSWRLRRSSRLKKNSNL